MKLFQTYHWQTNYEKKLEIAYIEINFKQPLSKLKKKFGNDKELFDRIEAYYNYYSGKPINYNDFKANNSFDDFLKILSKQTDNIVVELEKMQGNKWVYIELFNINFRNRNFELVEYYNEQALKIDKKFLPALINKAYLFLSEEWDCKEIIKILKYVTSYYQNAYFIYLLGKAYVNCNQIKKALKTLNKSLELKNDSKTLLELGKIYHYHLRDYQKALQYYQKTIKISGQVLGVQELGLLYLDAGKNRKAEKLYLDNLNKENITQDNYNSLIRYYIIMMQFEKAQLYLDRSIEKFGTNYQNNFYNKMINNIKTMQKNEINLVEWNDEEDIERLSNEQLKWGNNEYHLIGSRMVHIWNKLATASKDRKWTTK